jgi:hypothetical protein
MPEGSRISPFVERKIKGNVNIERGMVAEKFHSIVIFTKLRLAHGVGHSIISGASPVSIFNQPVTVDSSRELVVRSDAGRSA